jgi:hypothetical protein
LSKKILIFLGFCHEKTQTSQLKSSKFSKSDLKKKIAKCFETATDLTFLYLQDLDDKNASNNSTGGKYLLSIYLLIKTTLFKHKV